MTALVLNDRQTAAVLAGLRLVQAELPRSQYLPHGVSEIFDNSGTIEPLTEDELDDLCEELNCAPSTDLPALKGDGSMFGCGSEEIDQAIATTIGGPAMLAMSLLSDVQELITHGTEDAREQARQRTNIAKYIIQAALKFER